MSTQTWQSFPRWEHPTCDLTAEALLEYGTMCPLLEALAPIHQGPEHPMSQMPDAGSTTCRSLSPTLASGLANQHRAPGGPTMGPATPWPWPCLCRCNVAPSSHLILEQPLICSYKRDFPGHSCNAHTMQQATEVPSFLQLFPSSSSRSDEGGAEGQLLVMPTSHRKP